MYVFVHREMIVISLMFTAKYICYYVTMNTCLTAAGTKWNQF